jgi:hypothetical protein
MLPYLKPLKILEILIILIINIIFIKGVHVEAAKNTNNVVASNFSPYLRAFLMVENLNFFFRYLFKYLVRVSKRYLISSYL